MYLKNYLCSNNKILSMLSMLKYSPKIVVTRICLMDSHFNEKIIYVENNVFIDYRLHSKGFLLRTHDFILPWHEAKIK
jgi:hypothetical protein